MSFIALDNFPSVGDTCSQLQQYASLIAIAKKTNKKVVFFKDMPNGRWGYKFNEAIDIDLKWVNQNDVKWERKKINGLIMLDKTVFDLEPDKNYIFHSMFHMRHYWYDMKDYIIDTFQFREDIMSKAKEYIKSLNLSDKILVSIHNRRGDYTLPQHNFFCKLDKDYYSRALTDYFFNRPDINKQVFLIFTQDKDWFKSNVWSEDDERIIYVHTGNDYVDMCVMSLCDHNIIANSSYSFWSAILNKNKDKVVVCPKNYLSKSNALSYINENYAFPEWNQIDN